MLNIRLICVGKLKERYYVGACNEYTKRLAAYCKLEVIELPEHRLPARPTSAEIAYALGREAAAIGERVPEGTRMIALCVEGREMDSREMSGLLTDSAIRGWSRLCFVIGGSYGLHDSVKNRADVKLSMSKLTFPHTLARVILLEQLYRGFKIAEGGKYHK